MQAQEFYVSTALGKTKRLSQACFRKDEFPGLEQLSSVDFGDRLSLIKPTSCTPFEVLGHLESEAIAMIGYRLWTPLSAIQACLELLELPEEGEPGDRRSILELALQELTGLEQLIRECLALFSPTQAPTELTEGELLSACPLQPTLELLHDALLGATERVSFAKQSEKRASQWAIGLFDSANPTQVYEPVTKDERLKTSEEKAEHLKQLRNKLKAIVGHELRTPLCSLQVCLETFLSEPKQLSEGDRQILLELAQTDLERLHQLVQKFFTLSRLEQGLFLQKRGLVDLEKTVELVTNGFHAKQKTDTPVICLDISPSLPLLPVDEDKLVLALMQLLDNAFQFMGSEGHITIEARYRPPTGREGTTEDSGGTIEVVVADTGRGIEPQQLEKVFDCFYQEEDFLRRTVGGTGIGLSMCRKLIEAMGGKIWANSLGKSLGCHVHLTLPTIVSCTRSVMVA